MKKVVWITGASSGIGREVALMMAKQDVQLVVSGRNQLALDEISAQTGALVVAFDVTLRQSHLDAAQIIMQHFGKVDTAFFNAGDCEYIDVNSFTSQPFERMIQTNFMSMVYGVEAVLPLLKLSKTPHLVGMSSAVAYLGLPRSEAYGASKAAIRNFLEGLRISLAKDKICVSIVFPGFVKTPLTDRNDFRMPGLITAKEAALQIVKGIQSRKLDIKVPLWFVWTIQLLSILPSKLRLWLLKKMVRES